ncbi:MAG: glycosyltransferase family 4 protein [Chloroflexota bacterium]|nr:glycosyltransferase family 4 protein [Chloroflexota bacterium]
MASRSALLLGFFASRHAGSYRGVCEDLADRLTDAGWQIVTASGFRNRPLRMLDMLVTLWRARSRYAVAYIEVFSGLGFYQAEISAVLLRRLNKPYVLALHGGNLPEFARAQPDRVRRLLASAAAVTAPSDYLRAALRALRDDILLVPNALDLDAYTFRPRIVPTPTLIWLRAMHAIYNPTLAIRVVARLRHDFPDLHLWMVGPDKGDGTLEAVQAAITAHGVEAQVTIVGGVPKSAVPTWMNKGDLFISTTDFDNTPVSVIEAMASGACVVSTNVGGVPALVRDGVQGLLVPPDDADAMSAAVTRILTEPGLAESLSRAAHQHASSFDWALVLRQWDDLLLRVQDASA